MRQILEQFHWMASRGVRPWGVCFLIFMCVYACSGLIWGHDLQNEAQLAPKHAEHPRVDAQSSTKRVAREVAARGARIKDVKVDSIESPAFGGRSFGKSGRYELINGHFSGELDPNDPLNSFIVNIDRAPRNEKGMVEYSADFRVLKPVDMAHANGTILYDVPNRGTQRVFNLHEDLQGAYGSFPRTAENLGDGFLLNEGYTLVWSGWEGDIQAEGGRLTARLPIARFPDGTTYKRWISTELLFQRPARSAEIDYPAFEDSESKAMLYRRSDPHAPLELIPRDSWSFAKCAGPEKAVPSHKSVCMPTTFSTDYIYNLVYEARDPYVMGIGFAAIRDLLSFLRNNGSGTNPIVKRQGSSRKGNPVKSVIIFGQSQSGRFVRDWIYETGNRDSGGRRIVDGAIAMTAGSRRTFTNQIFSEPGRFSRQLEDHYFQGDQFPFTYATMTDPFTGRIDGILNRCLATRTCPKIMQWDSGSEAWTARDSLIVTDTFGTVNLPLPSNVRQYFFSSTQHESGTGDDPPADSRGVCQQLPNPNPVRESQRALLVAMETWITNDTLPPPSQYPKLADGTLVRPLPQDTQGFPEIPGVTYTGKVNDLFVNDYLTLPTRHTTAEYTVLVPKVDVDGNDIAGVRSTLLRVPLGTYTGWNTRRAGFMQGNVCSTVGSYIPFAKTKDDRGADPRKSLEERYGTQSHYVDLVREVTERLQKDRLLLPNDAKRIIEQAEHRNLGLPK